MRTRILLVCLLIGGWLTATADDLHPRHREALFYHLQGDSLEAGAHAMALQSRSEQTDPRLALLLAEIQIAYSMPKNAETTLMGVGADQVPHLAIAFVAAVLLFIGASRNLRGVRVGGHPFVSGVVDRGCVCRCIGGVSHGCCPFG